MKVNAHYDDMYQCLHIYFKDVDKSERGRVANIEIALLRKYGYHTSMPVLEENGSYTHHIIRERSTLKDMKTVKEVLAGFCITV